MLHLSKRSSYLSFSFFICKIRMIIHIQGSLVAQQWSLCLWCTRHRFTGSIPGSGRSPGDWNVSPLQYSCLRNPMDGKSLVSYNPWGPKNWTGLGNSTTTPTPTWGLNGRMHTPCFIQCLAYIKRSVFSVIINIYVVSPQATVFSGCAEE